jgi:hypothetical protein
MSELGMTVSVGSDGWIGSSLGQRNDNHSGDRIEAKKRKSCVTDQHDSEKYQPIFFLNDDAELPRHTTCAPPSVSEMSEES